MIYKQNGSTLRVSVRRNACHDPEYAMTVLRQAGMEAAEITKFISEYDRKNH
jgi:Fe-S cluster assembly iron-binding protein IscA